MLCGVRGRVRRCASREAVLHRDKNTRHKRLTSERSVLFEMIESIFVNAMVFKVVNLIEK